MYKNTSDWLRIPLRGTRYDNKREKYFSNFGDGAGAVVITRTKKMMKEFYIQLHSEGKYAAKNFH